MSDFPTLSVYPQECPSQGIDDAIKSPKEAGYVQTRPRFTRDRLTFGPIKLILDDADWALLSAHDVAMKTSGIFNWTHPTSNTVYQVRFQNRVKETPVNIGSQYLHDVEFTLEQV